MASEHSSILVIGLGRFGSATAATLTRLGREVMAIEHSAELVKEWSGKLTHVVEADSTNIDALRQVGAGEFSTAVVGIGTSIEDSVLTTANLVDLGVGQVWAKAISPSHGKILHRIGAHHVLYPESDAGTRVAHLVSSRMMEYIEFDEGHFAVVKMRPPREIQGFTLGESKVRDKYGVTIVGIKSPGRDFTYAEPTTRVGKQDLLIVAGHVELLGRFAGRPVAGANFAAQLLQTEVIRHFCKQKSFRPPEALFPSPSGRRSTPESNQSPPYFPPPTRNPRPSRPGQKKYP